jgi:alkylation response protein AidB-like acyl-CoA dehydrogenase
MDFSFTEEQVALAATIGRFARTDLNHGLIEHDRESMFPREVWAKCADMGIFGLPIPEEYGGTAQGVVSTVLAMEALGHGCRDNGLIFALNSQLWSCEIPILHFGTTAQKQRYLPKLCTGQLVGGHAATEPDSGSDVFSMKTRATKTDGGYVLNGSKIFITNAPIADILIVFAVTDESKGVMGLSAFIVERGAPGLSVGKNIERMGLRTAMVGELSFNDCAVAADSLLGREGAGSAIFNSEMGWERCCLFACHVGAMQRELENCVAYARQRSQFGQPIGKFQSIAHRIADMKTRVELSRLILYKTAWLREHDKPASLESAMAKLFISEAYVQTCLDSVHIHGAYGYSTELEIERNLRDSVASTIYSGSSEIQRSTIARLLGL